MEKQRKILVVRTDRVGDVVVTTPLFREIRKQYPDSFIAALVNPNSSSVLTGNPHIDVIIEDDLSKDSFWNIVKIIRKHRFTDGLLLMPTERAAYQLFFGRVMNRIGVGRKFYEIITFMKSVSRKKYVPLRHEADYNMDLARKIGVTEPLLQPEIFVTLKEKTEALEMLKPYGISENDIKIIIHTGSGGSSPNWSENKYSELIKIVSQKYQDAKILLTSKEMSQSFKNEINKINNAADISGLFANLRDLIKIIAVSNVVISSSTGPMHIASALNVNTISIFCHRSMNRPAIWGALGNKACNLEVDPLFCDNHCSKDKEVCSIETGISTGDVLRSLVELQLHNNT